MSKKTHAIGFLGTTLDNGFGDNRWHRWRPSVSLCMHDDLLIDHLYLLHDKRSKRMFERIRDDLHIVSPETQVHSLHFGVNNPWDFSEVYASLYDLAKSISFVPMDDYLIHLTTGTHVAQICWFLLLESGFLPAKIIQTSPSKEIQGTYQVIDLDISKYDALRDRFEAEQQANRQALKANIATNNPAYNALIQELEQVASHSTAPILLIGATGAGKSHLAKQLYLLKQERFHFSGHFVDVNCATLRGDSAMSALFGHVKGAFTGAQSARKGLLKSADGGLLFLDEIGELGLDEQAMLLTALEEQQFYPVGSDKAIQVDFQLMAGTNKDLRQAVQAGEFREDLFARLNTWTFFLPSLKQRSEDIAPNIHYELARLGNEQQTLYRFNQDALKRYLTFATSEQAVWRGNFRDLTASMMRLTTLAKNHRISLADVEAEILRLTAIWQTNHTKSTDTSNQTNVLKNYLTPAQIADIDPFDQYQLEHVINICQQHKNMASAGRYLFSASRKTLKNPNDSDRLRKYLAKFGLRFDEL